MWKDKIVIISEENHRYWKVAKQPITAKMTCKEMWRVFIARLAVLMAIFGVFFTILGVLWVVKLLLLAV